MGALTFSAGYWTLDGNGTHTVPSRNTDDYGIKVSVNTNSGHTIHVNSSQSHITLRYVHVYNAQQGGNCSYNGGNRSLYFNGVNDVKVQNCCIDGSFQDGIVLVGTDHFLVERSYIQRCGMLLACSGNDCHGQAIMFWGGSNQVIRWNIFNDNDGQGVLGFSDPMSNIRVYGNLFFNEHSYGPLYQGVNGGYWDHYDGAMTNSYTYNNTFANVGGTYPKDNSSIIFAHNSISGNGVVHNNLFYAISDCGLIYGPFTANSHSAYGSCTSIPGGTNAQSGLISSNFVDYAGFDFRLSGPTAAGLDLTTQPWWNNGADGFFDQLDYNLDMYGNRYGADGTWDRGAFEYSAVSVNLNRIDAASRIGLPANPLSAGMLRELVTGKKDITVYNTLGICVNPEKPLTNGLYFIWQDNGMVYKISVVK